MNFWHIAGLTLATALIALGIYLAIKQRTKIKQI